ncbi:MAG: phosphopantothenoylcysteine decarboxylase domain-containing protein [Planctomycetota bacterium]|jgi:phosphopantothenoylcysteine decarboxylase/phosphopantothenate--cysteine ligase
MSAESTLGHDEAQRLLDSLPTPAPGKHRYLITAGPTLEDIDRVRFIGNRSTGRMGIQVATAAQAAGHHPILVLGPTPLAPPANVPTLSIRSTRELLAALQVFFPCVDALVMAAAPADYRPAEFVEGKIHKTEEDLTLRLVRNPDILRSLAAYRSNQVIAGFSLDTTVDLEVAARKRKDKGLDIIVANSNNTFSGEGTDAVVLEEGRPPHRGIKHKEDLARYLLRRIEDRLERR